MRVYFLIQNFFSLLNIGLILYLLLINEEKNDKKNVKDFFSLRKIGCVLFVFVMRLLENKIQGQIKKLTTRTIELIEVATITTLVPTIQHRIVTTTIQTIPTTIFGLRLALIVF